ncbi:MAG: purine-nucleoside phosphorylase [Candidatus Korarchaeota archaeon]|nr:purine-nucleoside phosphorylase [Candidatus Korarchaeota archaeon]
MPKPLHILAEPGSIAERVVVAGDPARVKQLAEMLEEPVLVNDNRGLLVYTGKYRDVPVTVATHGIGAPSATIVFEELAMLGARIMVRLGTAGALRGDLDIGDLVVAAGAVYLCNGNSLGMYVPGYCYAASPSPDVTMRLVEEAGRKGEEALLAPVFSSDAFYAEDPEFARRWAEKGVAAVEMECAGLFGLGWMRGFKTGALLMISDSLVKGKEEMLTARELAPVAETAGRIVLDTLASLTP